MAANLLTEAYFVEVYFLTRGNQFVGGGTPEW